MRLRFPLEPEAAALGGALQAAAILQARTHRHTHHHLPSSSGTPSTHRLAPRAACSRHHPQTQQGVPVAKYVSEHEPPLAPETVEPDRAAAGAYEAAFAAHAAAGASLFGGR